VSAADQREFDSGDASAVKTPQKNKNTHTAKHPFDTLAISPSVSILSRRRRKGTNST
jgi:hypothetical protein